MQREAKFKQLKRLISRNPIDWDNFLELDEELAVTGSPSSNCTFPWVLSKYPPPRVIQELLSRYHYSILSDESYCRECFKAGLQYSSVEIINLIASHEGEKILSKPLDESLDIPLHRAGNINIALVLLNAFPEAVGLQNKDGNLPLHTAIMQFKSPDHIKSLILEGKRQQIGTGHGGILVKNNKGQTPFSILCHQVATGIDIAYLTFPLFRSDLRMWENLNTLLQECSTNTDGAPIHGHFRILHSLISSSCPYQAVHMGQMLAPTQIKEADETGRYPLSLAASQKSCRKEILTKLLSAYPQAIRAVDTKGRLPLHWAAISGRNIKEGTQEILDADPTALSHSDNDGMFPFMLAASNEQNSLNTVYQLLRECPENVSNFVAKLK